MEGLLSTGPTPSSFETQAEKVLKEVLTWVPKFFLDSREEAIFSSSFFGQSCEAYWWRVCYQRGLPCLV